jgi:hypothetical protein
LTFFFMPGMENTGEIPIHKSAERCYKENGYM